MRRVGGEVLSWAIMVALLSFWLIIGHALFPAAWAKHARPEKDYQAEWCNARGGQMEVVLSDGTRCDCLLPGRAIEFDFASKWAESLGQALNYARLTGRAPGVVLILESPEDRRYVERLEAIAAWYGLPIKIWTMEAWK